MVVGLFLLSQMDTGTTRFTSGVYMAVLGAGMGFLMQITMLVAQNSVEMKDMGVALLRDHPLPYARQLLRCRDHGGAVHRTGAGRDGGPAAAGAATARSAQLDAASLAKLPAAVRDAYQFAVSVRHAHRLPVGCGGRRDRAAWRRCSSRRCRCAGPGRRPRRSPAAGRRPTPSGARPSDRPTWRPRTAGPLGRATAHPRGLAVVPSARSAAVRRPACAPCFTCVARAVRLSPVGLRLALFGELKDREAARVRRRVLRQPQHGDRARRPLRRALRRRVAEGQPGAEDPGLAGGDGQPQAVPVPGAVAAAGTEPARALAQQRPPGNRARGRGRAPPGPRRVTSTGGLTVPGGVGQQIAEDALQPARIGVDPRLVHHAAPARPGPAARPAGVTNSPSAISCSSARSDALSSRATSSTSSTSVRIACARSRTSSVGRPGGSSSAAVSSPVTGVRSSCAMSAVTRRSASIRSLQRVRHGVHRTGQLVGLVPDDAADGVPDPHLRIALRDLAGRGRRLAQPARQLAADQHAERAAAEDHRDRADDQRLVEIAHDRGAAVGEAGVQRQHVAVGQRHGRPHIGHPVRVLVDMRGAPVPAASPRAGSAASSGRRAWRRTWGRLLRLRSPRTAAARTQPLVSWTSRAFSSIETRAALCTTRLSATAISAPTAAIATLIFQRTPVRRATAGCHALSL